MNLKKKQSSSSGSVYNLMHGQVMARRLDANHLGRISTYRKEGNIVPHDEERIAQFNTELLFRPCLATDPIGMEFLRDLGDPELVRQLVGLRLQTFANVYRAIAD